VAAVSYLHAQEHPPKPPPSKSWQTKFLKNTKDLYTVWLPSTSTTEALGEQRGDLSFAVSGRSGRIERRTGKQVYGFEEMWKPDMTDIKAAIQFVKEIDVSIAGSTKGGAEEEEEERVEGEMEVEEE
jgi:hypothetical protein